MPASTRTIWGRLLIVLQAAWCFIALLIVQDLSLDYDDFIGQIVAFFCLCVPVWAFQCFNWVLALKTNPFWTILLFLPLEFLNLWLLAEEEYDFSAAVVIFIAYNLLRLVQNLDQGLRGMSIFISIDGIRAFSQSCKDHKQRLANSVMIILIIILVCFIISLS